MARRAGGRVVIQERPMSQVQSLVPAIAVAPQSKVVLLALDDAQLQLVVGGGGPAGGWSLTALASGPVGGWD